MKGQALSTIIGVAALVTVTGSVDAQIRTMGKTCRAQVAAGNALNESADYTDALATFDPLVDQCKTKDGRVAVGVGRAHALNGLGRHQEAIAAADFAIDAWKKTPSVAAYFEKAFAEERLGDLAAAEADYNRVLELTEKNRNVAERATIYAKVADLNQGVGKTAEAESCLAKAVDLDPGNPDFAIMQGDWAVRAGNYDAAFAAYDRAVVQGRTDMVMYEIRTEARLKQMEEKYGTTNAQELRSKMNPTETGQVCRELTEALDLGLRDMKLDMFAALVCQ